MTARVLKSFLDALPPEKLDLVVYHTEYEEDDAYGVPMRFVEYFPEFLNPMKPWLKEAEGIYLE